MEGKSTPFQKELAIHKAKDRAETHEKEDEDKGEKQILAAIQKLEHEQAKEQEPIVKQNQELTRKQSGKNIEIFFITA